MENFFGLVEVDELDDRAKKDLEDYYPVLRKRRVLDDKYVEKERAKFKLDMKRSCKRFHQTYDHGDGNLYRPKKVNGKDVDRLPWLAILYKRQTKRERNSLDASDSTNGEKKKGGVVTKKEASTTKVDYYGNRVVTPADWARRIIVPSGVQYVSVKEWVDSNSNSCFD